MLALRHADTTQLVDAAALLFREYAEWLQVDLCFQDFAHELATLPGKYAMPDGRLYVAMVDEDIAGCIALRRFDEHAGEVKRLYVRPAFRGQGLGERLARQVIDDARMIGYARLVLDTLDHMRSARKLYEGLGFRAIAPYYYNPIPGAVYLALELQEPGATRESS